MNTAPYTAPQLKLGAFNCPHCHAYSNQVWRTLATYEVSRWKTLDDWMASKCVHCERDSVWKGDRIYFPDASDAPLPNPDTPDSIVADYLEARSIVNASPRGAVALLRLALQKLCKHLGQTESTIDGAIKGLVAKGLPPKVQEALDGLRVVGNEAVHPGVIDLKDDRATALTLFGIFNFVVERMITTEKAVDAIYKMVPPEKLKGIENRDRTVKS